MSKKRILIVEDEALTVLALQQELEELGYEIAGNASTAADALRAAEDNRADLVLMDIQLDGGISGIAAAAALRGHLDIPVVFLTAHASAETVGRAVESGAFGYLLKPYTVPELKRLSTSHFTNTKRKLRCGRRSVCDCLPVWHNPSPSEQPTNGNELRKARASAALRNCSTDANSLSQLGSQSLSVLFINETGHPHVQIEGF